jgi:hypothetical protein
LNAVREAEPASGVDPRSPRFLSVRQETFLSVIYKSCLSRIEKSQILTDRNVTTRIAGRGVELDDNNSLI